MVNSIFSLSACRKRANSFNKFSDSAAFNKVQQLLVHILVAAVFISSFSAKALTHVEASVDKNPVEINESFILTVTANDHVGNNAFDSSPLLADFIVGNTSTRSMESSYNGASSRTTTWTTLLIAREKGKKIIPALSVNQLKTQPIALIVLEKGTNKASSQNDIFITTDISSASVYVQELLTLTVKLHFSVELQRGSLSDPTLTDANISQVGKDTETDQTINGKRYRVIERTYAVSPQKSGNFILKSPVFTGQIIVPSRRRNSFMSFNETKPVSVVGDDIEVTVKAIPLDYQGAWLPSELVIINQEWQPSLDTFKVGEPITRVITLTAAGLAEEQLPELNVSSPQGMKVYPDQVDLHSGINHERLVSQKVQKFALVAAKAGKYELPEIRIPWWNVVTNKQEVAVLPAQTVTVNPNPDAVNLTNTSENGPSVQQSVLNENGVSASQQDGSSAGQAVKPFTLAVLWMLSILALLLSAACAFLFRKNKKLTALLIQHGISELSAATNTSATEATRKNSTAKARSTLTAQYNVEDVVKACNDNAGEHVLSLLPQWCALQMAMPASSVKSINDVINAFADNELSYRVSELQDCYFSKKQTLWQGKALGKVLNRLEKECRKSSQGKSKKAPLSLNP